MEKAANLGIWKFDKKQKKRYYLSLQGKRYEGGEGKAQELQDRRILKEGQDFNNRRHIFAQSLCSPPVSPPGGDDMHNLKYWGLPETVVDEYSKRGVVRLFDWQVECIRAGGERVLQGKNLVYSAPTSGGKTLVAEILMLRSLIMRGGTALFIVPFISLAEEKASYFQQVWDPLQMGIRCYHSSDENASLSEDVKVGVCTIERANSIVNRLLEEQRVGGLSIVVVDELHMIGDGKRGYLIELMLAKLRKACPDTLQIVGLSATLPNLPEVCAWLDAELYVTSFRPVRLSHFICRDRMLYQWTPGLSCEWSYSRSLEGEKNKDDADGVGNLCAETVKKDKGVLVFCASRAWTVSCAKVIAKSFSLDRDLTMTPEIIQQRSMVVEELRQTPVGLCPDLAEAVPMGVAYHNASLTVEERKVLETAFRNGVIKVLVATSTLAAGVNLPASRVIIRSSKIGRDRLDGARFHQMCGRAGRFGLDNEGEAILIVRGQDRAEWDFGRELISSLLPPMQSVLDKADGGGVERAILEVVCGKVVKSSAEARDFVRFTLLAQQRLSDDVTRRFTDALDFLLTNKFLKKLGPFKETPTQSAQGLPEQDTISCTQLGSATFFSSLSPHDSLIVLKALSKAQSGVILSTDLHLLYLMMPPSSTVINPSWENFTQAYALLHNKLKKVGAAVGVSQKFLDEARGGKKDPKCEEAILHKRFYLALILQELIQEAPLSTVSEQMHVLASAWEGGDHKLCVMDCACFLLRSSHIKSSFS